MENLIKYAWSFVGTPYKIGGDDPMAGIDCSGLIMELLIAAGVFPHGTDMTAQRLFDHFKSFETLDNGSPGALVFFGSSPAKVTHVGFCISEKNMIEAGGGRADTDTLEKAIALNAFVKMRPIKYRKDFIGIFMPKY